MNFPLVDILQIDVMYCWVSEIWQFWDSLGVIGSLVLSVHVRELRVGKGVEVFFFFVCPNTHKK